MATTLVESPFAADRVRRLRPVESYPNPLLGIRVYRDEDGSLSACWETEVENGESVTLPGLSRSSTETCRGSGATSLPTTSDALSEVEMTTASSRIPFVTQSPLTLVPEDSDPNIPDERFKLWTPQDLIDNSTPPVWTVKGMLIHPTYGFLAGAEKSLKSYLAQIIAVGVAAGVPVLGHFEVPSPVPVLMMCGEGGRIPYTRRLLRIADAYGVNLADLPLFSTTDVASVTSDVFRTNFVRNLKEVGPGLTIIEPFYAFHGSASEGKMLAVEGDMLTWMSHTTLDHGSSLIVGNHYNQTGTGSGLRRITGVGPAEWSDSWLIVEKDDTKSDVTTGHFELALEVGSRQWGGTSWDVVIDIGPFNDDTMDNEGPITWTVQRATGRRGGSSGTADYILNLVTQRPFEFTKSQIVSNCNGKKTAVEQVFQALGLAGKIEMHTVKRQEGSRQVTREVWGPRSAPAFND